jgi:hypothetical protein
MDRQGPRGLQHRDNDDGRRHETDAAKHSNPNTQCEDGRLLEGSRKKKGTKLRDSGAAYEDGKRAVPDLGRRGRGGGDQRGERDDDQQVEGSGRCGRGGGTSNTASHGAVGDEGGGLGRQGLQRVSDHAGMLENTSDRDSRPVRARKRQERSPRKSRSRGNCSPEKLRSRREHSPEKSGTGRERSSDHLRSRRERSPRMSSRQRLDSNADKDIGKQGKRVRSQSSSDGTPSRQVRQDNSIENRRDYLGDVRRTRSRGGEGIPSNCRGYAEETGPGLPKMAGVSSAQATQSSDTRQKRRPERPEASIEELPAPEEDKKEPSEDLSDTGANGGEGACCVVDRSAHSPKSNQRQRTVQRRSPSPARCMASRSAVSQHKPAPMKGHKSSQGSLGGDSEGASADGNRSRSRSPCLAGPRDVGSPAKGGDAISPHMQQRPKGRGSVPQRGSLEATKQKRDVSPRAQSPKPEARSHIRQHSSSATPLPHPSSSSSSWQRSPSYSSQERPSHRGASPRRRQRRSSRSPRPPCRRSNSPLLRRSRTRSLERPQRRRAPRSPERLRRLQRSPVRSPPRQRRRLPPRSRTRSPDLRQQHRRWSRSPARQQQRREVARQRCTPEVRRRRTSPERHSRKGNTVASRHGIGAERADNLPRGDPGRYSRSLRDTGSLDVGRRSGMRHG